MKIQNSVGFYNEEYTGNVRPCICGEVLPWPWVERSTVYLLGKPTFHTFSYGLHEKQKLARL